MNAVRNSFEQLVRRRLWPVAALLLVVLVAAPLLLKSRTEPVETTTPAVAATSDDALSVAPLVTADTAAPDDRRVLGARKDPFRPTGEQSRATPSPSPAGEQPRATAGVSPAWTQTSAPSEPQSSVSPTSPSASTSGGATGAETPSPSSGAPAPVSPPDVTPEEPKAKPSFALYSPTVRVDGGKKRAVERLAPLVSTDTPSIIYLGLLDDEKTAVFLVDEGVTADGDGSCHPSPDNCQRIYLRKGETESFTRAAVTTPDGTAAEVTGSPEVRYRLDIVDIHIRRTASTSVARAARAAVSSDGRRALRSRMNRLGRLRYDRGSGTLHRLSVKAYRTAMARASGHRTQLALASARASVLGLGPVARATSRRAGLGAP